VKLVDCDSFQIRAGGKTFFCEGGVETFTPPELQGKSLSGVIRTRNHDNFGLAILVFQTLFMGRHPFAGRYLGTGNIPIDKAISECRFPYGSRRAAVQMEPPPSSPSLHIVGDDVAFLFERAFAQEMIPGGRPEPSEWVSALQKLERNTKQCAANPSHWHLSSLTSCPWCRMEGETGVALFPFLGQQPLGAAFDIETLWRQVSGIPHPGPAPTITGLPPKPSNSATSLKGWDMRRKLFGACAAGVPVAILLSGAKVPTFWIIAASIAMFFIVNKLGDQSERVVEIRRQRDARSSEWARIQEGWGSRAGPASFDLKKAALESLKNEWVQIPNLRLRRLDALKSNQRNLQLEAFLDRFDLDRASVQGIGPARKQMLVSYGIETAADITEGQLAREPGFGPVLRSKLMTWRKSAVDKFRFDPRRNIDPRHIAKVEQDVLAERKRIEDRLRSGIAELRATAAQILAARQQMRPQLEQAHTAYLQAVADFDAAKS
jgi:DNA-binding helix-hairpin-helix protein with protein kinase domain